MRVLIVSDAWRPQVNGVARTLVHVVGELGRAGNEVRVVHPGRFATLPCPSYPEIRLALFAGRELCDEIGGFMPQAIHIATEGPGVLPPRLRRADWGYW